MEQMDAGERMRWVWLTHGAMVLALVLVAVRCMQMESIRDPVAPLLGDPGNGGLPATPEGPNATVSTVLSWVGFVPMLLVLLRRSMDDGFRLTRQAWHWPMGVLGVMALVSVAWAGDKFESLITAMGLASGLSMLWASSQIIRSHRGLRVVAGMMVGLLLVFAAQAFVYRFVEWPDLVETWKNTRQSFFQQRGWAADSFEAQQFERNITNRALLGFFVSPNTYAAAAMLGMFVSMGVFIQRYRDNDDAGWMAAPIVGIAGGLALLAWSGSRTAMLGGVVGLALLGAFFVLNKTKLKPSTMWWLLVASAGVGVLAIVAIGLSTGGLFHDSLTFRWRYWVGSSAMFLDRPLLGTGWANFGDAYLQHRVPTAAEEIKDPHNLFVRFATELGVVGLVASVAWLLWISRAVLLPRAQGRGSEKSVEPRLLLVAVVLILLVSVVCAVDLNANVHFAFIEVLKRLLFVGLIALGWLTTCVRSGEQLSLDDRPAGWIVTMTLVGLGVFVMHSMVDMVMLETGPLLMFAVLVGAIAGLKSSETEGAVSRWISVSALTALSLAWLAAGVLVVMSIAIAESHAKSANDLIASRRSDQVAEAQKVMRNAIDASPVTNFDYVSRLFAMSVITGQDAKQVADELVLANPTRVQSYLDRARLGKARGAESALILADYEQAVRRNPREMAIRLEYADVLMSTGQTLQAKAQLESALEINDAYDPGETRRMRPEQLARVQSLMSNLPANP
jgi:O-antigen ligase